MNIIEHLDEIDRLVIEHAAPASRSTIRGHVVLVREQIEALQADYSSLKNTHSVFKNQTEQAISELKEEHHRLVSENKAIDAQLAEAKGETPLILDDDTVSVLRAMFELDRPFTKEDINFLSDLGSNISRYHFSILEKNDLIQWSQTCDRHRRPLYIITPLGIAHLRNLGLLPQSSN